MYIFIGSINTSDSDYNSVLFSRCLHRFLLFTICLHHLSFHSTIFRTHFSGTTFPVVMSCVNSCVVETAGIVIINHSSGCDVMC